MDHISIALPASTRERLKSVLKEERTSVSQFVRDLIERAVEERERTRLQRMYKGLTALKGQGKPGVTDSSLIIDQTLYGVDGAWKGQDA